MEGNRSAEAKWYVVHTRTGYENKVKTDLLKTVENRNMQDRIQEIRIPTEEVVEVREVTGEDGKVKSVRKTVQRHIYPCYIMVKMVMDTESWYVVRNASGVTGFVGPGSDPIPLTDEEVAKMGIERVTIELDVEVGDSVRINDGLFENFVGVVTAIDRENQKVTVMLNMMGKETPTEVDFVHVKKV